MLHRALASLLCVLGVAVLGLAVASATLWRPSDTLVAEAQGAPGTTLLVTDPGVLDMAAGKVTIRASATTGTVMIALGRTVDVQAWIGNDAHTRVTGLTDWTVLGTKDVAAVVKDPAEGTAPAAATPSADAAAAVATPAPDAAAAAGATPAATVPPPDPSGSDLWVDQAVGEGEATLEWTRQDGRWSVLVATIGEGAAIPEIALVWPQKVTTPWLVPGLVVGGLLLVSGLGWWCAMVVAKRRLVSADGEGVESESGVPDEADPGPPVTRRQARELQGQRQQQKVHGRSGARDRVEAMPRTAQPTEAGTAARPEPNQDDGNDDARSRRRGMRSGRGPTDVTKAEPPATAATASRVQAPAVGGRAAPAKGGQPTSAPGGWPGHALGGRPASTPGRPTSAKPAPPRAASPAATADAWRRAWGMTGADNHGEPSAPSDASADQDQDSRRMRPGLRWIDGGED